MRKVYLEFTYVTINQGYGSGDGILACDKLTGEAIQEFKRNVKEEIDPQIQPDSVKFITITHHIVLDDEPDSQPQPQQAALDL
jgi:hypothetical protein